MSSAHLGVLVLRLAIGCAWTLWLCRKRGWDASTAWLPGVGVAIFPPALLIAVPIVLLRKRAPAPLPLRP
jgi:hypothetical protein